MQSTMHLYPIDGAVHRVGRKDTPFSYRDAKWAAVIVGVDPDPANREQITSWCKDYWDALHPYSAGGAYVNFMMDEGQDRVQATYREHYEKLAVDQAEVRPGEPVPRQPEHQAGGGEVALGAHLALRRRTQGCHAGLDPASTLARHHGLRVKPAMTASAARRRYFYILEGSHSAITGKRSGSPAAGCRSRRRAARP